MPLPDRRTDRREGENSGLDRIGLVGSIGLNSMFSLVSSEIEYFLGFDSYAGSTAQLSRAVSEIKKIRKT